MRPFDWGMVLLIIAIVFHIFMILRILTNVLNKLEYIDEIFKKSDELIEQLEKQIYKGD